ncbi:hypothetical protein [Enterococcus sp. AZ007]|uniref:hypothetical protein n=1 Tax=Enterococcus sp. AZ007 TaxID=2774839 RepID=UPI003F21E36A
MKKIRLILIAFLFLLIIGGCSTKKSPSSRRKPSLREQYITELKNQSGMNHQTFTINVDDVSIGLDDKKLNDLGKSQLNNFEKRYEGLTIKGAILQDKASRDRQLSVETNLLNYKTNFDLYSINETKDIYLSTDITNLLIAASMEFVDDLPVHTVKKEIVEDKYLHIQKSELTNWKQLVDGADEQWRTYLKTRKEGSFKKDKKELTYSFTKKDVERISYFRLKETDKKTQEMVKDVLDTIKEFTLDLRVDKANHTRKGTFDFTFKNGKYTYSVKGKIQQQFKDSEENVELPEPMDLISLDQFAAALTTLPEPTEEEITEIFDMIRAHQDSLDAESIAHYQSFYREYMNDEQFQRLNQLLDELSGEKGI